MADNCSLTVKEPNLRLFTVFLQLYEAVFEVLKFLYDFFVVLHNCATFRTFRAVVRLHNQSFVACLTVQCGQLPVELGVFVVMARVAVAIEVPFAFETYL